MSDPSPPADSKRKSRKVPRGASRTKTTFGVEIGYSTIRMVRLKTVKGGQIVFEKCQSFEFNPSLDLASAEFTIELKKRLKQFCGSAREHAIWAVSSDLDQARLHHIKIPQMSQARLPGAVYWGLQREEAFVENETVVDFQIEEDDVSKTTLSVTGAIVERKCVDDIKHLFSQTGYPLSGIGVPLISLQNLVNLRSDAEKEAPVLICQFGHSATSVSVLLGEQFVFTRNIPLGLQNFAESLVKDFDPALSQEEACQLVFKLGMSQEAATPEEKSRYEKAVKSLSPTLERTVRQIQRTIEYYQSNFDAEPMGAIYLGGEIATSGDLFKFFSEQLSSKVIAIDPFETPELQESASQPLDRVAYGPAFGLALATKGKINLFHTYNQRQSERKSNKIAIAVCILFSVLTATAAIFYHSQRSQLKKLSKERDGLEVSLKQLGPPITKEFVSKAAKDVKELQKQRKEALGRYEGLALLSEITRVTPENISLLHVSAVMDGPITFLDSSARQDKTAAKDKGTMILRGVVTGDRTSLETSLTIYIARLDQSNLFDKVEVESTELVDTTTGLHLTFTFNLKMIAEPLIIIKK